MTHAFDKQYWDQIWQVTAADIAVTALTHAAEHAVAAGVDAKVDWIVADLSTCEPSARYDLVTTHHAHPRCPSWTFTSASLPGSLPRARCSSSATSTTITTPPPDTDTDTAGLSHLPRPQRLCGPS